MARRKNVKRIDPRYFLNETVNRGEELEEGCGDHEEAMAIDIEGPGVDLQVNDISDLPPEEAFVAGLEVAKDAIDQLMGGPEDLPPEGEGALQEFLKEDRSDHIHGISEKIGRLEAEIERAEDSLEEAERLATDPYSEEITFQNLMDLRSRPAWYETQLRIGNMRDKLGLLGQQAAQLELSPGGPKGPVGQLARPEY